MTITIENWVHLNNGRKLGFITCGDEDGLPVFYCHGFPGSRLEVLLADDIATHLSIRLIGVDRPGYGLSDPQPLRNFTSWASDIVGLADILRIPRFHLLGVSGGGPYAAACAYTIPFRLLSVGIVCGLAPITSPGILHGMDMFNRFGLLLSSRLLALTKAILLPVSILIRHHPNIAWRFIAGRAKQPDRSFLKRRDIRQVMCMTFREAMRCGIEGASSDLRLYATNWGFRLNDIRVPVDLWHGKKDHVVPITMGRWMAASIPGCHAAFSDVHGHFSLIIEGMQDILRKIASRSST